ncbi:cation diffusion facilitator family transporter [Kineothrix alysoides]|uniref:Cation diffusion facilitator family transporter n=1 Tax=Kineothrix alysoides TaxID=1469948 RepID=A0A4R1R360_9FIRM|nr:cation diffusion facilitator family transporter [Kineothrix alysoides]TCL59835.1 cation diffusion facilitator family transporter [Kineothrix alysoides]
MVSLLTKIFIKDRDNTSSPQVRQAYGVLCGTVGIFLNILLFIGKFLAGIISNSIAVTADAFNNLSDAGSSLITLIGFKMAGQKPDPGHPFGHGRIEYLSGLLVSIAILIMAFELVRSSVDKIIHPQAVEFSLITVIILAISIGVKLYMTFYNKSIGKKIDSAAMSATAMDSLSDTMATTVVLIAALVGKLTGLKIDGYCGIMVALFIFYAGYCAAKETVSPLLGQPPHPDFVKNVETIVMSYEHVLGIHDMIVHDYGPGRVMLSLHAEVPADGDILTLHDMIDNIEHRLHNELHCEAVIHMDPVVTQDEQINALKSRISEVIITAYPEVCFHDFRVVKGPTHTNIIFDIVVPFHYKKNDEEITNYISEQIRLIDETYMAVIQVDKAYNPHAL